MKEVFISYSTKDMTQAETVRNILEQNGLSCWMAPRDIPGGSNYTKEIPVAIRNCQVFVLILSNHSQNSPWVLKEVDSAVNSGKVILPFMLENFDLNDEFNFLLTGAQRYFAYQQKAETMQALIGRVRAIVQVDPPAQETPAKEPQPETHTVPEPQPETYTVPEPQPAPAQQTVNAAAEDAPEFCPKCGSREIQLQKNKYKCQNPVEYGAMILRTVLWSLLSGIVFMIVIFSLPFPDELIFITIVGGFVLGGWWGKRRAGKKIHYSRLRHGKQISCYRCNNCRSVFNHTVNTRQSV